MARLVVAGVKRLHLTSASLFTAVILTATLAGFATGTFDFLFRSTGWQMGFSVLPQRSTDPYWWTLGLSFINTILLSSIAIVIATIVGTLMAIVVAGGNPLWGRLAKAYIQIFRNTPLLLQALFWFALISRGPPPRQSYSFLGFYFSNRGVDVPMLTVAGLIGMIVGSAAFLVLLRVLRQVAVPIQVCGALLGSFALIGIVRFFMPESWVSVPEFRGFDFRGGLHIPTELLAILIGLSMFGSAYIAEIVRGGFQTVSAGAIEAAKSLALPRWVIEAKIRIPLALRAIVLPLGSQFTVLVKATSIGLAVGFTDLFAVTLISINQSGRTIALLCLMTVGFVLINQLVVSLIAFLNRAVEIPGYGQR